MFRFAARNYYEVLGITNRFKCTNKDIREAYLKKCKKYHPDVKLSNQSEQEIKLINEAYSILSKEKEKAFYDLQLDRNMSTTTNYHVRVDSEELLRRYYDEMLRRQMEMNNAKDTSFNNNNKYYGIDGIPRVSNFTIICICGGVIITGIIVHFLHYHFVLSNSFERLQLKSKEIGETYLKKKKELSL